MFSLKRILCLFTIVFTCCTLSGCEVSHKPVESNTSQAEQSSSFAPASSSEDSSSPLPDPQPEPVETPPVMPVEGLQLLPVVFEEEKEYEFYGMTKTTLFYNFQVPLASPVQCYNFEINQATTGGIYSFTPSLYYRHYLPPLQIASGSYRHQIYQRADGSRMTGVVGVSFVDGSVDYLPYQEQVEGEYVQPVIIRYAQLDEHRFYMMSTSCVYLVDLSLRTITPVYKVNREEPFSQMPYYDLITSLETDGKHLFLWAHTLEKNDTPYAKPSISQRLLVCELDGTVTTEVPITSDSPLRPNSSFEFYANGTFFLIEGERAGPLYAVNYQNGAFYPSDIPLPEGWRFSSWDILKSDQFSSNRYLYLSGLNIIDNSSATFVLDFKTRQLNWISFSLSPDADGHPGDASILCVDDAGNAIVSAIHSWQEILPDRGTKSRFVHRLYYLPIDKIRQWMKPYPVT